MIRLIILAVLLGTPALSDTCPPPMDKTVTVICLTETAITVHASNTASAQAALALAEKRPMHK